MTRKMSKVWARKALKAIDEIIVNYKRGDTVNCPLCLAFVKTYTEKYLSCADCPWTVFRRKKCHEAPTFAIIPREKRFRRLFGWRTKCINIIRR